MKPTTYKIIILEDKMEDVEMILHELKKAGLRCAHTIAKTKTDYERALTTFKPDLILADYSLPGYSGLAAFNIKQELLPDVPFIVVSGMIGEERAVELIKFGVDNYVVKDALYNLPPKIKRAMQDKQDKKDKMRAEIKLKEQHEKLLAIAFLQSHQVRAPVANILGLISLFNAENQSDPVNGEVIMKLQETAAAFDVIIHNIIKQTHEIKEAM